MIQIDAQITELSTTVSATLGVDWSNVTDGGDGLVLLYEEETPDFKEILEFFQSWKYDKEETSIYCKSKCIDS